MTETQITPEEVTHKLVEGLKILKEELRVWRTESRQNQEKINEIETKLNELMAKGGGIQSGEMRDLEEKAVRTSQQYEQIQEEMKNVIEFNQKVNALKKMLDETAEKSELSDEEIVNKVDTLEKTVLSMSEKIVEVGQIKSKLSGMKGAPAPEIEAKLSSLRLMLEEIGDGLSQLNRLKMQLDKVETETERNISEMDELRDRIEQLGMGDYDGGPSEGVAELKSRIDELADRIGKGFTAETEKEFIGKVKTELKGWLKETKENASSLKEIREEIKALESKGGETKKLKSSLTKIRKEIAALEEKNEKIDALGNVLMKHGEEIDQVYSFIGKEKLDIENLEVSLQGIKENLANWENENVQRLAEIKKMQNKMKSLRSKRELSDKEIESMKTGMNTLAVSIGKVSELGKMGPKFFKDMKQELDLWHAETKQNAVQLDTMRNKLVNMSKRIKTAVKLRQEVGRLGEDLTLVVNETANRFTELKKAILMHGDEFESIYSLIGKEELDIEKLGIQMNSFKKKLAEWRVLNEDSIKQSRALQSKLEDLRSKVSGKKGLPIVINELEEITKDIEVLKAEEKRIERMEEEIEELRKRIEQTKELRTEIKDLQDTLSTIADNVKSFQELRKDLSRHADELLAIHAAVGRKDIEIKRLDVSVRGFKEKLKLWEVATHGTSGQLKKISSRLDGLGQRLMGREGIPKLSKELILLSKDIKKLERDQITLRSKQKELVAFDDKIEKVVQGTLRGKISRKELEEDMDRLQFIRQRTFPAAKLKRNKKEAKRLASNKSASDLQNMLTQFTEKLKTTPKKDQKKVWEDYEKKVLSSVEKTLKTEKSRIKSDRASGRDVSKRNLIYAKAEMRSVSLGDAFSSKDLKEVITLVEKLAELKAHLKG